MFPHTGTHQVMKKQGVQVRTSPPTSSRGTKWPQLATQTKYIFNTNAYVNTTNKGKVPKITHTVNDPYTLMKQKNTIEAWDTRHILQCTYKTEKHCAYEHNITPTTEIVQINELDVIDNRIKKLARNDKYFIMRCRDPIPTKSVHTHHPSPICLHLRSCLHPWYLTTTHQSSPRTVLPTPTVPFTPLVPAYNTPHITSHRSVCTYCAVYTLGTSQQHTILPPDLPHT